MRRLAGTLPALDDGGQACQCNQALLHALKCLTCLITSVATLSHLAVSHGDN